MEELKTPCRNSCKGFCCEEFVMTHMSMPERARCAAFTRGETDHWLKDNGEKCTIRYQDTHVSLDFINDMLVPLNRTKTGLGGIEWPLYTCRHFDKITRSCTIYDQRPGLCRTYPDYGTCEHAEKGCTFTHKPNTFVNGNNEPSPGTGDRETGSDPA